MDQHRCPYEVYTHFRWHHVSDMKMKPPQSGVVLERAVYETRGPELLRLIFIQDKKTKKCVALKNKNHRNRFGIIQAQDFIFILFGRKTFFFLVRNITLRVWKPRYISIDTGM